MTDPAAISGLSVRYRADSITGVTDGTLITSWPDTSGNGYTGSTPDNTFRPIWKASVIGGKPVVRFTGDDAFTSAAPAGGAAQTIIMVGSITAGSIRTIRGASGNGGLQFRVNGSNTPQLVKQFVADVGSATSSVGSDTATVITTTYDSSAYAFYIAGTAAGSGTSAQTLTATTTAFGYNQSSGSEFFLGDVAELLVWNRVLTSGERSGVHSYVQDRYGITVSDYVSAATRFINIGGTAVPVNGGTSRRFVNVGGTAKPLP